MYYKLLSILLCLLSFPSIAQEFQTKNYFGMETSMKEGILSKVSKLNNSERFNANMNSMMRHSNYEYFSNTNNGINIPFASINDGSNVYITGTSSNPNTPKGDFVTIKVDENGNVLWEVREESNLYSVEFGTVITLDGLGNPIVSGVNWNGDNMDIKTIKYDASNGNIIWEHIFSGIGNGLDTPTAISLDNAQNVVVTGVSYTGQGVGFLTLKYNKAGTLLWSAIDSNFTPNTWNEPLDIAIDTNNNILVSGYGYDSNFMQGYYSISYNSMGVENWRNLYIYNDENNPTNSIARGNTFDANGNSYVTGTFDTFFNKMGTIKYDSAGNIVWIETFEYDGDLTDAYSIYANSDGNLYVSGIHFGGFSEDGAVLVSYDKNGVSNWDYTSDAIVNPQKVYFEFLSNSEIFISSIGMDQTTFEQRIDIYKLNNTGALVDETNYIIPFSPFGSIVDLINIDITKDNANLVSWSFYSNNGDVFEFSKLPLNTNTLEWSEIYSSTSTKMQILSTVNDSDNNIYVAGQYGTIVNNEYFENFQIVKYNEEGQVEWQKTFNQDNGNSSNSIIIGVDNSDNIIVYLKPYNFEDQFISLKKYDPQGNLLWETEKDYFNSNLYEMFFDDSNNVYITGTSFKEQTDSNAIFTISKFASSGIEEWTTFYQSSETSDNLYSLNSGKVDSNGNIYVTGMLGSGDFFDQTTNLILLKLNSEGVAQWISPISIENANSSGVEVILNDINDIYVTGYSEDSSYFRKAIVLKFNSDGENQWLSSYTEADRKVSPYTIKQLSTGNIIMSSYSLSTLDGSNRIAIVNFDDDGNQVWTTNSELNRFYRDIHVDDSDNIYVLNQMYDTTMPKRILYSVGSFTIASLILIDEFGNSSEEFFVGPELSAYNPNSLNPLNDGRLIIGGKVSHEMNVFEGLYFFETQHDVLSIDEVIPSDTVNNWLGQNYPNPGNTDTSIPFYLRQSSNVNFKIYDSQGRKIRAIDNQFYPVGNNALDLNISNLQSGLYFYSMETNNFKFTRKMIVK
ncbi:T9SS type A sorting domain-containing protein [Formosa sp. 3Alg 14/1]|uniref:T9SS type A sorting domain-containing protein n=1 Tax=Formosa sp. 3Alg 14/1 TaxID=3382190 RepID=UPI0039BE9A02